MRQSFINLQRAKALTWVVCTVGLILMLSQPVWAGSRKTYFTSVGTPTGGPTGGTMFVGPPPAFMTLYGMDLAFTYNEAATDSRMSGQSVVYGSMMFDLPVPPSTVPGPGPMWGRYHMENDDGAWDGYWIGKRTEYEDPPGTPHLLTTGVTTAIGSGAYEGLVARWELEIVDAHLVDDNGVEINPARAEGYIIEARGGPGDRPMQSRSEGTELVGVHPGLFVEPAPPAAGVMVTWEILNEVAQASHLGRSGNQGLGLLNPLTGEVSGGGCLTSANGDKLYWVATGTSLGENGPVDLTLHWAGGTGQFEAAVGSIRGDLVMEPADDPSLMDFSLNAGGSIRY